ncbi:hypothetical protein C0991_009657 [Blastosporella zonata]|nr:hypothetical protein C0991_009657 [Blastosporella zonata]
MEHGTLTGEPVHLKYFDVSKAGFAWRDGLSEKIAQRRVAMGDRFIIDILLEAGGIERPEKLFPPLALVDLELLLHAIELSDYDHLKKECLIYYLLKWHNDGRELRFQTERSIPSQFANLAEAYWHLDAGHDVARAVSLLSDRRLNGDYASKIIHAISLSPNPSPLIVQYVRTAKPHLNAPFDLWTYTLALADLNLLEAWQFQRTFNETTELRTVILSKLLEWCISPTPRSGAVNTLLSLPLSPFEEKFLRKYALEPPATLSRPAIPLIRDLVCVRLIQSGKHAEAVKIEHEFAASTLNESKSDAQARRKMVRELYDALPLSERTLLDAELEGLALGKRTQPAVNGIPKPKPKPKHSSPIKDIDMSLSQSWEEIPRPPQPAPLLNGHVHTRGVPSIPASASNSLYGLSSSTNGAPPILPISMGTPTVNRPRPSFPLASSLSSSTSRQPALFPSIPISSGSGSRQPPSASQPLSHSALFSSANRKANAFYNPPPVTSQQGIKRPFESTLARDMDVDSEDEEMATEHVHEDYDEPIRGDEQQETHDTSPDQRELNFSVFGHAKKTPTPTKKNVVIVAAPPPEETLSHNGRRVPPGAFTSDDENDEEAEFKEATPPPPPPSTRARPSTRKAQQTRAATRSERSPEAKRARRSEHPKPRQSIPGGLMHSDDDEEEEEEDQVAPLLSPPRRGAARRVRESTPGSDMGDEETGGQTRRRSSRLSSTGGEMAKKSSSSTATTTKAKKTTRATATKRKR